MNDPFLSRDWADTHKSFTADLGHGLDRVWKTIKTSLDLLHRHEFDAPWKHDARRGRKPRGAAAA